MMRTNEELILASHVRTLALALRSSAKGDAVKEAQQRANAVTGESAEIWGKASENLKTAEAEWLAAHPLDEFLLPALRELQLIADLIAARNG